MSVKSARHDVRSVCDSRAQILESISSEGFHLVWNDCICQLSFTLNKAFRLIISQIRYTTVLVATHFQVTFDSHWLITRLEWSLKGQCERHVNKTLKILFLESLFDKHPCHFSRRVTSLYVFKPQILGDYCLHEFLPHTIRD